jgi:hypothetical protein
MDMFHFKVIVSIGLLTLISLADENKTPPVGTWTGTIGKAKINACFQGDDGSYYYLKYLLPIGLKNANGNVWKESDTYEWVIETVTDTSITGKWVDLKKNSSQPIKLSLLGSCSDDEDNSESACGCNLFNNPIEKLPPVKIDTAKNSTQLPYRTFSLQSGNIDMVWFELMGGSSTIKKINQVICKGYPPNANEFFSCRRGTLAAFGSVDAEYGSTIKPYLITSRLLVVSKSENGFCGGAHPFSGVTYSTFDLVTGDEVSVSSWVQSIEDNEKFRSLILSQNPIDTTDPDNKECNDMLLENSSFSVRLDTEGLVFYTEFGHCCQACDEEFLVSFQELAPFLTEEGKNAMKFFPKKSGNK